MKKTISILAMSAIAAAYSNAAVFTIDATDVFADGVSVGTYTITQTGLTVTETVVGADNKVEFDADLTTAAVIEIAFTFTDSNFSLDSIDWTSTAGSGAFGIGARGVALSLDVAADWSFAVGTWDAAAGAVTAGQVISSPNGIIANPHTDDLWTLSAAGDTQTLTYGSTNGGTLALERFEANFNFVETVPEPSSSALLGLGALGLLVRRKR